MIETISHIDRLAGALRVPGDKSISHRALILGAMADGTQSIRNIARSDDIRSTIACLRALGFDIDDSGDTVTVGGATGRRDTPARCDAGNSGTTARLLAGFCAGAGLAARIDGDDSLRRRPMRRVADPLREMGARIEVSPSGGLPMEIAPAPLRGIAYRLPIASAQVKSAILIAGIFATGRTTVDQPVPTRDHTERMLASMGATVTTDGTSVSIEGGTSLHGITVDVPGDFSSAAPFLALAAAIPGSTVAIRRLGVNPTRTAFLDMLARMGADIRIEMKEESAGEPVADVTVQGADLTGIDIDDPEITASMIDEFPLFAVVAATARGTSRVRNADELRHKESDRIATTVALLQALSIRVDEHSDGFTVEGGSLHGGEVDARGDHRIAMAAAVAGAIATGITRIEGADAVNVSYPSFFTDLRALSASGAVT